MEERRRRRRRRGEIRRWTRRILCSHTRGAKQTDR
jgi:hypothetical protein